MMELVPERLRGETASFDIKDNDGNVIVEARSSYYCSSYPSIEKQEIEKLKFLLNI